MAERRSDTAEDVALEPTLASGEVAADTDALGATLSADAGAGSVVELPEAPPDRYTLGDEVGRGGLGTVVAARDRSLRREVAIKALHAEGGSARRRFVREALITARLEHPSIVPVHDAGRWPDGSPFYAMKLVRGRPLAAVIDEQRDLAARLALVPTVLAVCDAVAYAHSERVVHRDLKPHNVLVGEFGETVVIDWGLAKELGDGEQDPALRQAQEGRGTGTTSTETVAGSVLGTPAYMAPEQALGGVVDERADVYALGAMLYHVLVGKPPHDGGSIDEVLDRAVSGAVVPLTTREPGVPRDLAALVGKAMARRPEDRYPSARELADDLRRFTTGQLVGAHRYTWPQRARRWLVKHRGVAVTVAAAVAAVAVIATVSVRDVLRARDRADHERDVAVTASARADEQRAAAQAAGNRAVLAQARGAIEKDPAEALDWLATLSVDGPGWDAARVIAADALWRDPPARVLRGHRGTPRGLAVSSATRAVSWDDGAVWLWDLAAGTGREFAMTRTQRAILCADGGRILGEGVRPDGALSDFTIEVATGATAYGTVTPAERTRCGDPPTPMPDDCDLVAATPDGQTIACGDPSVSVRHGLGGTPRVLRKTAARLIAIDDDGRWLAAQGTDTVDIYDLDKGTVRWSFPLQGELRQLAFGPAGNLVLVGADGYLLDLVAGTSRPFGSSDVIAAAYLPDGRLATVGNDRALRVWAPRALPPVIARTLSAAALSPGGTAAIAATADRLIRLDADRAGAAATLPGSIEAVAIRDDGAAAVSVAGGDVWLWRTGGAPARLGPHPGGRGRVEVAWLGDDVVSWNGETVRVWPRAGASFRELALPPPPPPPTLADTPGEIRVMPGCAILIGAAPTLVLAPRGRTLAVARDTMNACDQLTYVVDVDAGTVAFLDGARGRHPAFTPDARALVTSAADGAILIWDLAATPPRPRTIAAHLLHPHGAAVSADGAWVAVTGEGAVALAHPSDAIARVLEPGEANLVGAAFDAPGSRLIVGASSGAWIWDLGSGEARHVGVGVPFTLRAPTDAEIDLIGPERRWHLVDDLPRTPAALHARLAALGYSLPAPAP